MTHLLTAKNYKVTIFINKEIPIHERLILHQPLPYSKGLKYTLYPHGKAWFHSELALVRKFLAKHFKVKVTGVRVDNIFISRGDQGSNYDLAKVLHMGRQLYGDSHFFSLEPEIHRGLLMQPRQKPAPSLTLHRGGSVIVFGGKADHHIATCQQIVDSLLVEQNLRRLG